MDFTAPPATATAAELRRRKGSRCQQVKLLALLQEHTGDWVPLPAILRLGIAQYNARILDLRRQGHDIRNKNKWVEGTRHSWFGLDVPEGKE